MPQVHYDLTGDTSDLVAALNSVTRAMGDLKRSAKDTEGAVAGVEKRATSGAKGHSSYADSVKGAVNNLNRLAPALGSAGTQLGKLNGAVEFGAGAMGGMGAAAGVAVAAIAAVGVGTIKALAAVTEFARGVDELREKAYELGRTDIITTAQVAALEDVRDAALGADGAMLGLKATIATQLAPAATDMQNSWAGMTGALSAVITKIGEFDDSTGIMRVGVGLLTGGISELALATQRFYASLGEGASNEAKDFRDITARAEEQAKKLADGLKGVGDFGFSAADGVKFFNDETKRTETAAKDALRALEEQAAAIESLRGIQVAAAKAVASEELRLTLEYREQLRAINLLEEEAGESVEATEAAAEARLAAERQYTQGINELAAKRTAAHQKELDKQVEAEKKARDELNRIMLKAEKDALDSAEAFRNAQRMLGDAILSSSQSAIASLQGLAREGSAAAEVLFLAEKAGALASVAVNTLRGAVLAQATIPPPGGQIAAGAIIVAGAAAAAQIAATAMGSSGMVSLPAGGHGSSKASDFTQTQVGGLNKPEAMGKHGQSQPRTLHSGGPLSVDEMPFGAVTTRSGEGAFVFSQGAMEDGAMERAQRINEGGGGDRVVRLVLADAGRVIGEALAIDSRRPGSPFATGTASAFKNPYRSR